jgi:chromosome segregation ATPase
MTKIRATVEELAAEDLQEECTELQAALTELGEERDQYHEEVDRLKDQNKTLRTAFKANQEDNEEYLERIEELEARVEELEADKMDAMQTVDVLREYCKKWQDKLAHSEKVVQVLAELVECENVPIHTAKDAIKWANKQVDKQK